MGPGNKSAKRAEEKVVKITTCLRCNPGESTPKKKREDIGIDEAEDRRPAGRKERKKAGNHWFPDGEARECGLFRGFWRSQKNKKDKTNGSGRRAAEVSRLAPNEICIFRKDEGFFFSLSRRAPFDDKFP